MKIFPVGPFSFSGERSLALALLWGLAHSNNRGVDRVLIAQDPDYYEIILRLQVLSQGITRTRVLRARVFRADKDEDWFQTEATVSHLVDLMVLDLHDDYGLWRITSSADPIPAPALVIYQDGRLKA